MARLTVAVAAAAVVGYFTGDPYATAQTFSLVPGYGPPQTKRHPAPPTALSSTLGDECPQASSPAIAS